MEVATESRVDAQLVERRADLRGDALTVVVRRDPARLPHQIEDREIRNCGPERQATTLERDRAHLRREPQLVGQPRLAEAGIAGNADDLSLRRPRSEGPPDSSSSSSRPEKGVSCWCASSIGDVRGPRPRTRNVDGALVRSVDGHRVCLLEIEVPTQVGRGRGTHQHICRGEPPRAGRAASTVVSPEAV